MVRFGVAKPGKHPAALMEFAAAIKLGCDRWLVYWYLVQSALQIQDCSATESALTHVVNAAPDFVEAQVLFEKLGPALSR